MPLTSEDNKPERYWVIRWKKEEDTVTLCHLEIIRYLDFTSTGLKFAPGSNEHDHKQNLVVTLIIDRHNLAAGRQSFLPAPSRPSVHGVTTRQFR